MKDSVKSNRYIIIMLALINFVMTPLLMGFIGHFSSLVVALNFTFVILASIVAAERKIPKFLSMLFGFGTLASIWLEFIYEAVFFIQLSRLLFSFALFTLLAYILIRTIYDAKAINLKIIVGAMSGYILLGIMGGVIYELLELLHPGAVGITTNSGGYNFYYFSFISLTTVGYGDIVPRSAQAQAIAVLLSIVGQFYMAIGVAVFVGKFLNYQSAK